MLFSRICQPIRQGALFIHMHYLRHACFHHITSFRPARSLMNRDQFAAIRAAAGTLRSSYRGRALLPSSRFIAFTTSYFARTTSLPRRDIMFSSRREGRKCGARQERNAHETLCHATYKKPEDLQSPYIEGPPTPSQPIWKGGNRESCTTLSNQRGSPPKWEEVLPAPPNAVLFHVCEIKITLLPYLACHYKRSPPQAYRPAQRCPKRQTRNPPRRGESTTGFRAVSRVQNQKTSRANPKGQRQPRTKIVRQQARNACRTAPTALRRCSNNCRPVTAG